MPNTEVKLRRAENTWWVTARENRYLPALLLKAAVFGSLKTPLLFKFTPNAVFCLKILISKESFNR